MAESCPLALLWVLKPYQHQISTDKIQGKKTHRDSNYYIREWSHIKVLVSVHWLAQCHTKWPRGCRGFQHPALGLQEWNPSSLTHCYLPWPLSHGLNQSAEENSSDFSNLATWNLFWCAALLFSDCSGWISRPDTLYQNSWTQTIDQYIVSHSI